MFEVIFYWHYNLCLGLSVIEIIVYKVAASTSNGERRTFGAPHRQFYIEMSPTLYGSVHSFTANNWLKNKTEDEK